jgi:predicted aspartyl protease
MPIIPVMIFDHIVWAFVDSGATFSIIAAKEAKDMGIDWQKGKCQMIVVGDGSFIPVYLHNLTLTIGGKKVKAPVGFSDRLGVGFNILGRKGIFEHFKVCFSDKKKKITFSIE